MKPIHFTKYHGTGNDFVVIDDRDGAFDVSDHALVSGMCDRHFGIGADGLILIRHEPEYDFRMIYFNSDGLEGSMCGNGARCAVAFYSGLDSKHRNYRFTVHDGVHTSRFENGNVVVSMADVVKVTTTPWGIFADTGSPHLVVFVEHPDDVDVQSRGKELRYTELFRPGGVNVNFVSAAGNALTMRTYERGVEAETLSCGTGAVAAAVGASVRNEARKTQSFEVYTRGGKLEVKFNANPPDFTQVELAGPAIKVFTGSFYP